LSAAAQAAYDHPMTDDSAAPSREPCDVCRASGPWELDVEVALSGVLVVRVHRCASCGFAQVRPRLGRDDLDALYPADYFDDASAIGFRGYARRAQPNERAAYFLARRMRTLGATGPVLEVGCALGFLLDALRRFAPVEVRGVDVSRFAASFAREHFGLAVDCGTLEEAGYEGASFGVVVAKDLLEHVLRPRELLAETARILRPGGLLWIVTPNGEGNLRPLRALAREMLREGRDEVPVLTQGHLSFFSREHVARLLDESGFDVVRLKNTGVKRGLRALGWLPRRRDPQARMPRGAARPGPAHPLGEERFAALRVALAESLRRERRAIKSHPAYYWQREIASALDSLPAPLTFGIDFDVLARKR
jgi:2-polyprenyl-3-methyl-5-hydroxy-6-metoxy-1,4-benzoquinol methylase